MARSKRFIDTRWRRKMWKFVLKCVTVSVEQIFFAKINNILYRIFAFEAEKERRPYKVKICYGRTLSDASMLYFAHVFLSFFMRALVGQTAERIFTKLSHVVDIRCNF